MSFVKKISIITCTIGVGANIYTLQVPSQAIFSDLPPPPKDNGGTKETVANSGDPVSFDPFGLNEPKQDSSFSQGPLLTPRVFPNNNVQEEGEFR